MFFRCGDGDHLSLYLHLERGEVNERTPTNGRLCALPAKRSGRYGNNPVRYYSATSTLVLAFHTKPSGNGSPSINVPAKTAATKAPSNPSPSHVVIAADESISSSPPSVSGPYGFTGTFRFIRKSTSSLSFSFHPSGSTRLERLSIVRSHGNEKERKKEEEQTAQMRCRTTGPETPPSLGPRPFRRESWRRRRRGRIRLATAVFFFFFLRCVVMGRPDCSMRLDVRSARALLAESNSQFVLNPTGQFRSDGQRIAGSACDYQFISQGGSAATNPGVQQRRGKFYSPLYPSLYPPRSRCFYHFYGRYIYGSPSPRSNVSSQPICVCVKQDLPQGQTARLPSNNNPKRQIRRRIESFGFPNLTEYWKALILLLASVSTTNRDW